jgi:uncharacterized membrane protein YgcG
MRFRVATIIIACFTLAMSMHGQVHAQDTRSLSYDSYKVDIKVNSDSTVEVVETMQVRFMGNYRGVIAEIPLHDPNKLAYCTSAQKNCGGFDSLSVLAVHGNNGELIDRNSYSLGKRTDEDTEIEYFVIKWEVWPSGKSFGGNEVFTWSVKYKLFGSLLFNTDKTALLYWNAIPQGRGGSVRSAEINIILPTGTTARNSNLNLYDELASHKYSVVSEENKVNITTTNLPAQSGDITVEYLIAAGAVNPPVPLDVRQQFPWLVPLNLRLSGEDLSEVPAHIPAGRQELVFSYPGYQTQTEIIEVESGKPAIVYVNLQPQPHTLILLFLNLAVNALFVLLIPVVAIGIYNHWRKHGRDEQKPATIIPLFSPPTDVRPYLAGSLVDERVDTRDLTGTIIDLAYRGFIKITETAKSEFKLTKLTPQNPKQPLDEIENYLIDALFGSSSEVTTKELAQNFYPKYQSLVSKINLLMVQKGYFARSPQRTRQIYGGWGCAFGILGILTIILSCTFMWLLLGVPGVVFVGIYLAVRGLGWLLIANYMPAKTALGSKTYSEVAGFKMYMHHAERYRLADLTPEEFERYLGYAVSLDVASQWSNNFKDIYHQKPDWYEGSADLTNIYWTNRFLTDFSYSLQTNAFSPIQGNNAKGSGWGFSGGGFGGGFSGGGGGGGFRGGF